MMIDMRSESFDMPVIHSEHKNHVGSLEPRPAENYHYLSAHKMNDLLKTMLQFNGYLDP
jgi:hypothetical protein